MAENEQLSESMWTCCDENVYDDAGVIEHLRMHHGLQSLVSTVLPVLSTGCPEWDLDTYEVRVGSMTLYRSVKTYKAVTA